MSAPVLDFPGPYIGPFFLASATLIWLAVGVHARSTRKRSLLSGQVPSRVVRDRLVYELSTARNTFPGSSHDNSLMVIQSLLAFGATFTMFHWVLTISGLPALAIGAAFGGCVLACIVPEYVANRATIARAEARLAEFDRLHPGIRDSEIFIAEISPRQPVPRYREQPINQRQRALSASFYHRAIRGGARRTRHPVESL